MFVTLVVREALVGVDYTAVLMVGQEFDDAYEAAEFLRAHGIEIPDEDSEEMEDGLCEYLYSKDVHQLSYERLNYYSGGDYGVLGWRLSVHDPANFCAQVVERQTKWAQLFNAMPDIVHTVKVH
jgi:hypothetical protein